MRGRLEKAALDLYDERGFENTTHTLWPTRERAAIDQSSCGHTARPHTGDATGGSGEPKVTQSHSAGTASRWAPSTGQLHLVTIVSSRTRSFDSWRTAANHQDPMGVIRILP
jgi:hypothetical protein